MKFYVHCEDPEFTIVVNWDSGKTGTLGAILDLFIKRFTDKYPGALNDNLTPELYSCTGVLMDLTKEVSKEIKHMNDLYVRLVDSKGINEHKGSDDKKTNINEKKERFYANKISSHVEENQSEGITGIAVSAKNKQFIEENHNLAIVCVGNEKYRNAICFYNEILQLDPTNKSALIGLTTCYLRADRIQDGLKTVKRGLETSRNDLDMLYLKGKLLVACGDGDNAIDTLISYCKLARQNGGVDKEEKFDVQVLLAKGYIMKHQKDMAINILQGVLRENQEHVDALAEYAALLFPIGSTHSEEAINVLLTLLAKHTENKNIKQKFADVCSSPNGMMILKSVAEKPMQDVAALVFLATSLRDCSAVKEALELMERALHLDPSRAHSLLTYVHMLELVDRHRDGIAQIKLFVCSFPEEHVGKLTCGLLNKYLINSDNDRDTKTEVKAGISEVLEDETEQIEYTDDERYLLAVFFTLIKLLYLKAELSAIPPLLELLEPRCTGRYLHLTNIRNEAAYYSCIAEIFRVWKTSDLYLEQRSSYPGRKCMYFLGDSHCMPPAWQEVCVRDEKLLVYPVLSTGTKIWHLRPDSKFYPKTNFYSSIRVIPENSDVITCFGEIDCREALLICWEKARYDTIEDGMEMVVQIYIRLLDSLQKKHQWNIYVHPVVPVLDLTRPIVMQFNKILATELQKEPQLHWLNFVGELLTDDGTTLKEEYKLDGTHLHPSYVTLIEHAISAADKNA